MNKLRILLVHDTANQTPRFCRGLESDFGTWPSLPPEWDSCFTLDWIRDPFEARWLIDAADLLSDRPEAIGALGIPPEVVLFDYSMMRYESNPREPNDPTDVVRRMQVYLEEHKLTHPLADKPAEIELKHPLPNLDQRAADTDRVGCYIGGVMARAFALHPCAGVPCTVHTENKDTDVPFFEWLCGTYFGEALSLKNKGTKQFEHLLSAGVAAFRGRVSALLTSGKLILETKTIHHLIDNTVMNVEDNACLSFHSIYGKRELPLRAIFSDVWEPGASFTPEIGRKINATLKEWVHCMFKTTEGYNLYRAAWDLQEQYQKLHEERESSDREEIHELVVRFCDSNLAGDDLEKLISYGRIHHWPAEHNLWPKDRSNWYPDSSPFALRNGTSHHLPKAAKNKELARLATLFMCIYVSYNFPEVLNDEDCLRTFYDFLDPLPKGPLLQLADVKNRENAILDVLTKVDSQGQSIGLSLAVLLKTSSRGSEKHTPPTPHEVFLMKLFAMEIGWKNKSQWSPWLRGLAELH